MVVTDNSNKPLKNVRVIIRRLDFNFNYIGKNDTLYTDSSGYAHKEVIPIPVKTTFAKVYNILDYKFRLQGIEKDSDRMTQGLFLPTVIFYYFADIQFYKDDYYNYNKRIIEYEFKNKSKSVNLKVKLTSPIEYFDKNYFKNSSSTLKQKILKFIDLIRVNSLMQSAELSLFSIKESTFKGKKYLDIGFNHLVEFNSLKMDKYDIGKRIFNDVVRKILSPLNEYIYDPDQFWGYNISVKGKSKDFSSNNKTELIEYHFYLPGKVVRKYKNKDITGQDLLDASIILINDERFELKLQ